MSGNAQQITVSDWQAMEEELCRSIEIVDGTIAPMPAANPRHSTTVCPGLRAKSFMLIR